MSILVNLFVALQLYFIIYVVSGKCSCPATYWTDWLDRDNPSGHGDYEGYSHFTTAPCNSGYKPVGADCRVRGSKKAWYLANKVISDDKDCNSKGFECVNINQGCSAYKICCPDYEIRFLCYKP